PQEASIFRKLTVEQNILAILETLDLPNDERLERLRVLLDELGIARLAKSKAQSLSGGERRRLEITRALVISPSFMLLDEPFAGIDPIAVVDIQSIVTQLKTRGIGVLITEHNVRETLGICDRAYIVSEGEVLEEGDPAHIAGSRRAREIYLGEKFRRSPFGSDSMMADTRLVQQLRMTQQLVMTPQLRQAIKILQVSRAELESLIDQELTENPVLEEQQSEEKVETGPTVDGQSAGEEWQ